MSGPRNGVPTPCSRCSEPIGIDLTWALNRRARFSNDRPGCGQRVRTDHEIRAVAREAHGPGSCWDHASRCEAEMRRGNRRQSAGRRSHTEDTRGTRRCPGSSAGGDQPRRHITAIYDGIAHPVEAMLLPGGLGADVGEWVVGAVVIIGGAVDSHPARRHGHTQQHSQWPTSHFRKCRTDARCKNYAWPREMQESLDNTLSRSLQRST